MYSHDVARLVPALHHGALLPLVGLLHASVPEHKHEDEIKFVK